MLGIQLQLISTAPNSQKHFENFSGVLYTIFQNILEVRSQIFTNIKERDQYDGYNRGIENLGNIFTLGSRRSMLEFVKGTHMLPLETIASQYNDKANDFLERCSQFGGEKLTLGDVSAEFHPFLKVPATLILWSGDEEFPPEAQFLLDSTCTKHLSTDVLWAVAMVNCLSLLQSQ